MKSVGLLKRAGQGERRAAMCEWAHIWTGGEGYWTMMKVKMKVKVEVCLMGVSFSEAAKARCSDVV